MVAWLETLAAATPMEKMAITVVKAIMMQGPVDYHKLFL